MKLISLAIALTLFPSIILSGQSEVTISRKDFKTDKPGFDAAWQHVKDGDSFYSKGGVGFKSAFAEYRAAYSYNGKNAELNYKLGVSCLFSDKRETASEYFLKALAIRPDVAEDILLLTGRALQYAGQYEEAVKKYNEWLASGMKKTSSNIEKANRYIAECRTADLLVKDSLRIEIRNIGSNINSTADEYSEVISRDGEKIYFASRRPVSTGAKNSGSDKRFDENIYRSDIENGKWSVSLPAAKNLNSDYSETPLDIDSTGTRIYIYAGYEGNGDIKAAEFKKGEWRSPVPESFGINSPDPETSFSISPLGNEIAFISDRGKNGKGGKDVYFIFRDQRRWSRPVNAGENINSGYDEESVRFSKGGDTLWFSSSGRNSAGGFDIFYSTRKGGGQWSEAVNAGYPINTPWDEFFYFPSPVNDSLFYFVSNRSGGFGGLDIYTGRILRVVPDKPAVTTILPGIKVDSIPGKMIQPTDTVNVTGSGVVKTAGIK